MSKTSLAKTPTSLQEWLTTLSAVEQHTFQQLQARLTILSGDASQLSDDERGQLQRLAERYAENLALASDGLEGELGAGEDDNENATLATAFEASADDFAGQRYAPSSVSPALLRTPFAGFVRNTLLTELCKHGGQVSDAIIHAFNNKWLPDALRDPEQCLRIYKQYQVDIDAANTYRDAIPVAKELLADKVMAVGLAWFSYVFRLHDLLKQGLDMDRVD